MLLCENRLSGLKKDYLISYLRSQVVALRAILRDVEESDDFDRDYVADSIKRVEKELHRFRKFYSN